MRDGHHCPYFIDEQTEVQKCGMTRPRSHGHQVAELFPQVTLSHLLHTPTSPPTRGTSAIANSLPVPSPNSPCTFQLRGLFSSCWPGPRRSLGLGRQTGWVRFLPGLLRSSAAHTPRLTVVGFSKGRGGVPLSSYCYDDFPG